MHLFHCSRGSHRLNFLPKIPGRERLGAGQPLTFKFNHLMVHGGRNRAPRMLYIDLYQFNLLSLWPTGSCIDSIFKFKGLEFTSRINITQTRPGIHEKAYYRSTEPRPYAFTVFESTFRRRHHPVCLIFLILAEIIPDGAYGHTHTVRRSDSRGKMQTGSSLWGRAYSSPW